MTVPPAISPMRDLLSEIMLSCVRFDGSVAAESIVILRPAHVAVLAEIDKLLAELERPAAKARGTK